MNTIFQDILDYGPALLGGLRISLALTGLSLLFGTILALVFALGITSRNKAFRWTSTFFVEIGRGAPALVLLQLMYYGLPNADITLSSFTSATLALTWTASAYMAEYIRGGLAAVPGGEIEGAQALGMSQQDTLRYVTIPQGIRIALPALMGFAVLLFQATSLAYSVAVPELMSQAYSAGSSSFNYLSLFIIAGAIYAAISIPATWLSVGVEKHLAKHL
ncbi:glutamine ABC transporter permease [Zafaria cholistanensis]|uniref:Glutamine ABC transporter permease n=1 Tax=Zafaria cholistanensis TaxID=1682741 RepID=A0A5A7NSV9_9MICC|nr:amino acid ABC transporter permease [Zafaria cholistanensis]GER23873.1 glutamine ABC transporter permease [Zafaria cholistanensis]